MLALYIILGIVILYLVFVYNSFVRLRNQVLNSYSGIDVQLKRRNDLIPNLVNAVKGYAKHEKDLLESLTKKRADLMNTLDEQDVKKVAKEDNKLTNNLKSLFAVSENYPDLKANQNFLKLKKQLRRTEDQIAASRRIYNSNVATFNSKIQVFPNNKLNKMFKFKKFDFYSIDDKEKRGVNIDF